MSTAVFPIEISVHECQRLRTTGEPLLLLDCREPEEFAITSITGSVLMPMQLVPERLAELHSGLSRRIIVHCHHGVRSLQVARFLRGKGFEFAQSMAGGIEAWSREIDPFVVRY